MTGKTSPAACLYCKHDATRAVERHNSRKPHWEYDLPRDSFLGKDLPRVFADGRCGTYDQIGAKRAGDLKQLHRSRPRNMMFTCRQIFIDFVLKQVQSDPTDHLHAFVLNTSRFDRLGTIIPVFHS